MERTGRCLCGAVGYTAKDLEPTIAACHCGMCRRWTGGPLLALGNGDVVWSGEDKIATYKSSDWAERGFCRVCGTSLYYCVTAPGPHHGKTHIAFGTLDDQSGFNLNLEYFIDIKPDAYEFVGDRKKLTEKEVFEIFSSGD